MNKLVQQAKQRQTHIEQDDSSEGFGVEKSSKKERTHGLGQQCGDCCGRQWVEVEEGINGISINGKNTIKK